MSTKSYWAKMALKILKTELAKQEVSYQELRERLVAMGINQTETNIRSKMSRGTFNTIFFLQCLKALGVKNLQLGSFFDA